MQYTIEKLKEAEYIHLVNITHDSQNYIINEYVDDITWDGFNFLSNIRKKEIWKATKIGAKKIRAMSVSALSMIASEILTLHDKDSEIAVTYFSKFTTDSQLLSTYFVMTLDTFLLILLRKCLFAFYHTKRSLP